MVAAAQADVVIAPGYGAGVVDALVAKRKNTRLLEAPRARCRTRATSARHRRAARAGRRTTSLRRGRLDGSSPSASRRTAELDDAELAFRICGYVKSNSIVLVRDGVAWGIGAGPAEPGRGRADRGAEGGRPGQGRRVRQRRLLSVPRRHRGRRRSRRGGHRATRRLGAGRGEHRQGRRARRRHGLHRRTHFLH